jgi:RNA polymerase sigma factor (sigma-70 family)
MQERSDAQLLCAFAGRGDEAAFREIVARYADLVYSAALRQVESSAAASDVSQSVFTDLARKAGTLASDGGTALSPSLAGWLHRATRYAALNHLRDARRRLTHERQAMEQLLTNSESGADWEQIRPMLDEALDGLSDEDREVLLLRYFKNQDFRAVGLTLGVSDDAAQKRVSRAVDRLREFFSKRNVTIGASGLVALLSANAVQSAPVGLAAAISAAAVAGTTVTTSTVVTATKAIVMTTLQKAIITTALVATVGTAAYEAHRASAWRSQAQLLAAQHPAPLVSSNDDELAALHGRLTLLTKQNAELSSAFDKANTENAQLKKQLEQTRHAAALFRELASQAHSTDDSATNDFSSQRDVFVAVGRKLRQSIQLKSQDPSGLSADEKAANSMATLNLGLDMVKMMKALKQFDNNTPDDNHSSADYGSCLLYGALDLNDQQFKQVYGVLQKYHDQAVQQNLSKDDASPETTAALKQMEDQVKSEFQNILTPEQETIFEQLAPNLQLAGKNFHFDFSFSDKPNSDTAAK